MIVTKFYKGQGLGNQLWVYAVLRAIAWKKNYDFGIESKKNFKAKKFMEIDLGKRVWALPHRNPVGLKPISIKKVIFEPRRYIKSLKMESNQTSEEVMNISDFTKIEGYLQSVNYIKDYQSELSVIMQVKNLNKSIVDENLCYINIRGGDFAGVLDISVPRDYYLKAIEIMKERHGIDSFRIITDDPVYASNLLREVSIISSAFKYSFLRTKSNFSNKVSQDFFLLQNAKFLILSNSTFAWWAAWTNLKSPFVIAPIYWGNPLNKHRVWAPEDIIVSNWWYLNEDGAIASGFECLNEQKSNQMHFTEHDLLYSDIKVKIFSWEKLKIMIKVKIYRIYHLLKF